jgi:hypothetical protein
VRECLESGVITEDRLREEIAQGHLRRDALRRRAKCAVE